MANGFGSLKVGTGPMGSGKTFTLFAWLRGDEVAGLRCRLYKPKKDDRAEDGFVYARNKERHPAIAVENAIGILLDLKDIDFEIDSVFIDEAQFIGEQLVSVVQLLLRQGINVYISALAQDYRGEPWLPIPELAVMGEHTQCLARCTFELTNGKRCGKIATRTQRFKNGRPAPYYDDLEIVGDVTTEYEEGEHPVYTYSAYCDEHHSTEGAPELTFESVIGLTTATQSGD